MNTNVKSIIVTDNESRGQPAFMEEWKICKEET
jgi:hypothetical protein